MRRSEDTNEFLPPNVFPPTPFPPFFFSLLIVGISSRDRRNRGCHRGHFHDFHRYGLSNRSRLSLADYPFLIFRPAFVLLNSRNRNARKSATLFGASRLGVCTASFIFSLALRLPHPVFPPLFSPFKQVSLLKQNGLVLFSYFFFFSSRPTFSTHVLNRTGGIPSMGESQVLVSWSGLDLALFSFASKDVLFSLANRGA